MATGAVTTDEMPRASTTLFAQGSRLAFLLLGPLEVRLEGRALELRRRKQRLLVTVLALRPGEVVSTDGLVADIWGSTPPKAALGSLQNLISELRKALGNDVVRTHGSGYGLAIEPQHVDLHRFEALVAAGRGEHMADRRAERLREGLGLWRGPPLAEFAFEPFAQVEIARLEELQVAAREELFEAELELGRHTGLVYELQALVAHHPLRERLRAQLMLALYRSGRQTDALAVYQDAQRRLRDDLGLEPSAELRRLQRAILNHDSRLSPRGSVKASQAKGAEFRLLGPVEVRAGGRSLRLGDTKQRALLAFLLLNANRVVARDRLITALWGEHPPQTAATALHGYVSGLRKSIGVDRIETRSPGYLLRTSPEEFDLATFERLHSEARAFEPGKARGRLEDALRLWRGVPLADLDPIPFVPVERLRLEELRLGAIEDRAEAYLALDRHAELISELQTLVRDYPLRERLRGQLMLALYRSGRQAEALEFYQHGRWLLAEQLGLQPGEALRRLERAILEHDPALHGADAAADPLELRAMKPSPAAEMRGRRLLRWRNPAAAFAAAMLAATAVLIYVTLPRGSEEDVTVVPNSVAIVDAETNRVIGDVAVGRSPVAVAFGEGSVWVANAGDGTVSRIDPKTRKEIRVLKVATDIRDLTTGFGSVWVANGKDGTLTRIDPQMYTIRTLRLGRRADSAPPVRWIAAGAGAVWAIRGNTLLEINPAANDIVAKTSIPTATGLTAGLGAAWVVTDDHRLLQIVRRGKDASNVTETVAFADHALAPTVGAGSVWFIVRRGTGEIWRIDPRSGAPPSIIPNAGRHPLDLVVDDATEYVWAVDATGAVVRVNPKIELAVAEIRTAAMIQSAVTVGGGAVWVAVQE